MTRTVMHPAATEVLAGLDRSREGLRAAIDSVPEPRRDQQPAPDRWSVAHILEHLALVEERLTATIAAKLEEAREAGLGREGGDPSLLSPELRVRIVDRSERRQAPDPLQPLGGIGHQAAWERAEAARAAFRLLVTRADGLELGGVIHEHPRFGALNVYQWAGFLAAHESRHIEQIREMSGQLQ
ncbi:MAG TPA: DinB family protein [Vicinamibacterales bacterium]|nr:DinB family protein [Vicinamibacterales bacterium]